MDNLDNAFCSISIYADENRNLIGVPCGVSEKYGVADIDKVLLLKAPYAAQRVEKYVAEIIGECYSKEHNDESDYSTIEKYMKIKGFANATKNLTLITVVKTQADGYSIMPAFNDFERGPIVVEDDEIVLPNNFVVGELGSALDGLLSIYIDANKKRLQLNEE